MVFAPMLETDIRAQVSTELVAADASDDMCAVVASEIDPRVAQELWRVRDRRGGYVRCETEFEA